MLDKVPTVTIEVTDAEGKITRREYRLYLGSPLSKLLAQQAEYEWHYRAAVESATKRLEGEIHALNHGIINPLDKDK